MLADGIEGRLRCIDATLGLILGQADEATPQPSPPAAAVAPPQAGAVLTADGVHGNCSGQTWDDFTLGDLIGRGGMGEVYLAWQHSLGREVAFKILAGATVSDTESRRRFADEARAAGRLHSAHVVPVIASGTHDGTPWLAMEYVRGVSLAELLASRRRAGGPLPPRHALALMRQAARGLADAHRERLVHRDLKPANLLLDADGVLKIADFGLVRFLDARTMTVAGTVLGTPLYAAPEQLRGLPTDARSDLYSLGVVLYEMLTLRPPFEGDSAEALIFQHNFAEPALPTTLNADLPQDFQAVCLKCMQKDPARRFADADALLADLDRLSDGLAPRSAVFAPDEVGTGAEEALRRLAPRRRRWPLLTGLGVVLLALVTSWGWWDARKTEVDTLRLRLAPLAQTAAIPGTATADLHRLAAMVSADDSQVVQVRAKLRRINDLAGRLDALGQCPGGALAFAWPERAELVALAEEIGPDHPRVAQRRAAIMASEGRNAELLIQMIPKAFAVVPEGDPRVAWWKAAAAAQADLEAFTEEVGPDGDPRMAQWKAAIAQGRRGCARLAPRMSLSRFNDELLAWESACVLPAEAAEEARAWLARLDYALGVGSMNGRRGAQRLAELIETPATPWAVKRGHDHHGPWCELVVAGIRQRLRWLPPVHASKGSEADEARPKVRLSSGRWVADSECSQELWQAVMETMPARNRGLRLPVEQVSAWEAEEFCRRLAGLLPGCAARLPSEAEWEIAAMAGKSGPWGGLTADQAERTVVHAGAAATAAVDVGLPNALGLLHMTGNVAEWCSDAYGPLPGGDLVVDPIAAGGGRRVVKGGSWSDALEHCRSANRTAVYPGRHSPTVGFRFVVDPPAKK